MSAGRLCPGLSGLRREPRDGVAQMRTDADEAASKAADSRAAWAHTGRPGAPLSGAA